MPKLLSRKLIQPVSVLTLVLSSSTLSMKTRYFDDMRDRLRTFAMEPEFNHASRFLNYPIVLDFILPPLVRSSRYFVSCVIPVSRSGFANVEADDPVYNTILCVVKSSI